LLTYYPEFVEEFPKPLQSWEKIEIKELDSEEEAFGANVLMLDPDTMILAKQYEMLIPEYDKRGIEVIEMPFNAAIHCGFGVRCAVGPLHRDS
jgi:N-dimethylarginine dimethylaminohydrolase